MLKGDLGATPLSDVLTSLAADEATGCLHIDDEAGDEALVYFKSGRVYAAYVPGRRPQLGARLISSGALAPEAMAEALEAQATELQGWRLGELLVHLGYVDRPVVEAFILEQLRESCFDLSRWQSGRFRFRKGEKTREDVGSHAEVADLLAEVVRRRSEWEVISGVVHGPGAVPVLSAGGLASTEMALDQDQWALLCKVDGERSIAQLARDCGFTTFEAGQIVFALVGAGLLDVEETLEEEGPGPIEPDEDLRPVASAIASVLGASAEAPGEAESDAMATLHRISSALVVPLVPGEADAYDWAEDVGDSGSELSRLLGGSPPAEEAAAEEAPVEAAPVEEAAVEAEAAEAEDDVAALPQDLRSELSALTAAIADLPSLGLSASLEPEFPTFPEEPAAEVVAQPEPEVVAEPEPEVVAEPQPEVVAEPDVVAEADAPAADPFEDSLARVSEALSALLGDALPAVAMPEPPKAPEPTPEEIEAARLEAERIERSRAAAAAELAEAHAMAEASRQGRLGSRFGRKGRAAAEQAAAEQAAAEEAARVEAERAEAERVAAEQAAAEKAERAEAERVAAEQAAAEEAARVEAERVAAEQAAAEEAERVEAERVAAEQAAAEEAARVAAEQAAAEEAARLDAERAEAERVAAEQAAAEEAARVAAEQAEEAARLEAERAEAERVAAEEAARAEAERAEAERVAAEQAEEAARAEAERAAAEAEPVDTFEVASMLRDINDGPADTVETIEEYVPDDAPAPTGADPAPAFANGSRAGLSETAALLRELTSLGLDDEPEQAPAARAAAAANPAKSAQQQPKEKKRKGLFGRG